MGLHDSVGCMPLVSALWCQVSCGMESRTCIGLSLCHINNLYNTCYWALLHSGLKPEEAEKTIRVSNGL
jgi:hypothetical protein